MEPFFPGRYAAIDVGSNSVLLLVADMDEDGRLAPVTDAGRTTRLAERFYASRRLVRSARERTADAVCEFVRIARRTGAEGIAAVGTSVLREAANSADFRSQVRQQCGLPIEVISGEQEAELGYSGNLYDRHLPPTDGERIVIDIGGGSTEIVRGLGHTIQSRVSFPIGAVRITEMFLRGDPPSRAEYDAADAHIEQALADVEPVPHGSLVLGAGGTIYNLTNVCRHAGLIPATEVHGAAVQHAQVTEFIDLFRSLPTKFRKRVPGLEPERADIIMGGAMILHQLMARLSAPRLIATVNGVRHGCIYAMARRALQRR